MHDEIRRRLGHVLIHQKPRDPGQILSHRQPIVIDMRIQSHVIGVLERTMRRDSRGLGIANSKVNIDDDARSNDVVIYIDQCAEPING